MKGKLYQVVPAVFSVYVIATLLVLAFFGQALPTSITNVLSISYLIFFPLAPVLRGLGAWSGEYWQGPSYIGIAIGILIYDLMLVAVFYACRRRPGA